MLNLILAVIWFSIGGILLLCEWTHPEALQWSIRGTGISLGWFALLLGLYNLARWWSRKLSKKNGQAWRRVRPSQPQRPHSDSRPADCAPDPNFIFTDQSTESTAEH